jgi:hypothetical protein
MITTVLAIFTLAASLGEEPPQIVSAHKTYEECQNVKQKLLHEKWQEMQKKVIFPACLRVVFEDVKIDYIKEEGE